MRFTGALVAASYTVAYPLPTLSFKLSIVLLCSVVAAVILFWAVEPLLVS